MAEPRIIFIYVTCKDGAQAETIAHAVVEKKLAACANIFPVMTSVYTWEGQIRSDNEAVLILKTTNDQFKAVEEAVRTLHSYDTPCIAALNVTDVNDAYRAWLLGEISQ